jgi:hypothetical protein
MAAKSNGAKFFDVLSLHCEEVKRSNAQAALVTWQDGLNLASLDSFYAYNVAFNGGVFIGGL